MDSLSKILNREMSEEKPVPKARMRKKEVKKTEIGNPTNFRHTIHLSDMQTSPREGLVGINVEGKQLFLDPEVVSKLQDCNLSSPVLEGIERSIDASPSTPPPPRPSRTPLLAAASQRNDFGKPVTSLDTPSVPPADAPIVHLLATGSRPISTKKIPAPPPPVPSASKPVLRKVSVTSATESTASSVVSAEHYVDLARISALEERTRALRQELHDLRETKKQLVAKVAAQEAQRRESLVSEEEPFVQVHIVETTSSVEDIRVPVEQERPPKPKRNFQSEAEPQAKAKAEPELKSQPEPETKPKVKPEVKPEAESEAKPKAKPQSKSKPKSESVPKQKSKGESEQKTVETTKVGKDDPPAPKIEPPATNMPIETAANSTKTSPIDSDPVLPNASVQPPVSNRPSSQRKKLAKMNSVDVVSSEGGVTVIAITPPPRPVPPPRKQNPQPPEDSLVMRL